jgi:hypothetical protein
MRNRRRKAEIMGTGIWRIERTAHLGVAIRWEMLALRGDTILCLFIQLQKTKR